MLLRYKTRQAKRHCTLNEEKGLSINTFYIHVYTNVEGWTNSEDLNTTGQMLRQSVLPTQRCSKKRVAETGVNTCGNLVLGFWCAG